MDQTISWARSTKLISDSRTTKLMCRGSFVRFLVSSLIFPCVHVRTLTEKKLLICWNKIAMIVLKYNSRCIKLRKHLKTHIVDKDFKKLKVSAGQCPFCEISPVKGDSVWACVWVRSHVQLPVIAWVAWLFINHYFPLIYRVLELKINNIFAKFKNGQIYVYCKPEISPN